MILFGIEHAKVVIDAAFAAITIPFFAQQSVKSVLRVRAGEIEQDRGHAAVAN
jgi:hypothetical protein